MQQPTLNRFYIFLFLLINIALKLLYVSYAEIAIDEPFSIMVAQMSINEIIAFLGDGNNPPLFELLLHPIIMLLGIDVPWVRLPSVIFSSFTVVYIYFIGGRFVSTRVAVGAAFIYTFATFQFYFAHEARVYALFNLLATASVYYFLSLSKSSSWKTWAAFIICNVLLLYSHYFGAVLLFIELSWFILIHRKNSFLLRSLGLSFLLIILLWMPQLMLLYNRYLHGTFQHWVKAPTFSDLYYNLLKMLNVPVVACACLGLFFAAFIRLLHSKRVSFFSPRSPLLFIFLWFVCGYFGLFVISFWVPVFLDRYLIFVSSALYLLIPISIRYLWGEEKMLPAMAIGMLLFMFTVNLKPDHGRRWQPLLEKIKATTSSNDCIVIAPGWNYPTVAYLYNRTYFKDYKNTVALLQRDHIFCAYNEASLNQFPIDSFTKTILLDGGTTNDSIQIRLRKTHPTMRVSKETKGVTVYYFSK